MLRHIALTVNDPEEIDNFYKEVLLFSTKHSFSLSREVTRQIFNTEGPVNVYLMGNNDTELEIFISSQRERKVFSHICLTYRNAEIIYNNAVQSGYNCIVKNSQGSHTYFIRDKSGNMFEIKELAK